MPNFKLTYKPYGPRAILIEWPQRIEEEILQDVLSFREQVVDDQIQDCIQAYCSLTLVYKHPIKDFVKEKRRLSSLYKDRSKHTGLNSVIWEIPVCYEGEFSLDLKAISKVKKMSEKEIIKRHSSPEYLVYFLGFLPGFLYLGGLDSTIHMPRQETPRLRVPKGAVAIGGAQTGIYPQESPGGWNIIGRSPITFFDIENDHPCFAKAGDRVKFKAISKEEFQQIEQEVQEGVYQLKSEVV